MLDRNDSTPKIWEGRQETQTWLVLWAIFVKESSMAHRRFLP
ncbi:MAG TPA: hypothetical protein VK395_00345 [Gemmataceae bacterium]|nr:hypothetical protein [Gemmataceae bacterium]